MFPEESIVVKALRYYKEVISLCVACKWDLDSDLDTYMILFNKSICNF